MGDTLFNRISNKQINYFKSAKVILVKEGDIRVPVYKEIYYLIFFLWLIIYIIYLSRNIFRYFRFKKQCYMDSEYVSEVKIDSKLWSRILTVRKLYDKPEVFCFGFVKPVVCLSNDLNDEEVQYAFLHEKMHILHGDCFYRCLCIGLIALHWYNPMAYLLYREMITQSEFYADESVMEQLDKDKRIKYGTLIINTISGSKNKYLHQTLGKMGVQL